MVKFSIQDLERVMHQQEKIRNFSIIAHVDHGKSTLTDSLFSGAGIIRMDQTGDRRLTDGRKDEEERGITIKSTGISLLFPPSDYLPHETVLNVIDSPGHVDFSSEVTAALRATDGALVVVDCSEGVCVQTETVLRQSLQEKIKPVLVINKLDRFFTELHYSGEEIYQKLSRLIESINVIISTYQTDDTKDFSLDPIKGNVAFAAGIQGWAFTLPQMADFLSKRSLNKISAEKILSNLWGDKFISKTGKVSSSPSPERKRGFDELIIKPIEMIFSSAGRETPDWESLDKLLPKLGVNLTKEQRNSLTNKRLVKSILQQWIPAHIALLDLSVHHLPSPIEAQKYRAVDLYTGPADEVFQSIQRCDANGPLVIYISKLAPEKPDDPSSHFLAFGRVLSGTIRPGMKVNVLGANYSFPGTKDSVQNVSVTRVCVMTPQPISISSVCAGNIVSLVGLDKYIMKTATICDRFPFHPVKNMTFSVCAVVQRAVEVTKASDMPKLAQAMKQLMSGDSLVQCFRNKSGDLVIAGAGELHLEICINDLQSFMGNESKIIVRDPEVSYGEIATSESEVVVVKSGNKHNRLFVSASPLEEKLFKDILKSDFDFSKTKMEISRTLIRKYEWEANEAKKVIGFFPTEGNKSNCWVDKTFGVQFVDSIEDHIRSGTEMVTIKGPLVGGEIMGTLFSLTDCVLHPDSVHRSGAQMIPSVKRAILGSFLLSKPRLMEPVYLVEITCPRGVSGGCHSILGKRRSRVIDQVCREGTDLVVLYAYMPVAESFGFSQELRAETGGQAFPQMIFDHWDFVPGDPLEEGSYSNILVKEIRSRKKMPEMLPTSGEFTDKL